MSRIGKQPVTLPPGVTIKVTGSSVEVKGKLGQLERQMPEFISFEQSKTEVVVQRTSLGGTFDIIIDGQKTNKRFFMDSVTGRVVVVPAAVVDGLIDGDGDEVFGNVGTGLGGSSIQVTAAPA